MTPEEKLAKWGAGPWVDEPDRAEWYAHGLPCIAQRAPLGHWCGYAAVPPGHPAHGLDLSMDDHGLGIGVHGGVTYADTCQTDIGICHVPKPGEPDNVWWLGFDCAHASDFSPFMRGSIMDDALQQSPNREAWLARMVYRDLGYVTRETNELAEQLAAMVVTV
jgi:hypothetical protein